MVWKEPGKDKDPWGDEGGGSPDIEKLVENLQHRFKALFGRRRHRRNLAWLWTVPLLLAFWLLSGFYVVDAGDRGVELLLGRLRGVTAPGLHWHAPWPLGESEILGGVDQGADYVRGYTALLTADGNAVSAEIAVHYRIVDIPRYLYAGSGGSAALDILGNLTDAAVSLAVSEAGLNDLLGRGVDAVESSARLHLLDSLQHRDTGLEVTQVVLRKISVPAPVTTAYTGVRQAELDARKQADTAEAYAAEVLPRAHGEADKRVADAKAYAGTLLQRAEGDAAAFETVLAAYRRAPAATRETLYLSTMEEILGQVQHVLVVGKDDHVTLSLDRPSVTITPVTKPGSKPPAAPKQDAAGGGPP